MAQPSPRHALAIYRAALRAADPSAAVLRHVRVQGSVLIAGGRRYPLNSIRNLYVIGAGKAGAAMGRAIEQLLSKRITGGLLNINRGSALPLRRIDLRESGHPVPDRAGVEGARRIAEIARGAGEHDLAICLISGGASALLPLPVAGVGLAAQQRLTRLLLESGANIQEINCIRKHLSLIKGGQLARLAYPARVLALILSDVIGDDPSVIGSGPTVPDSSTFAEAGAIFTKYALWKRAPPQVAAYIRAGKPETPKPGDPLFGRVQNLIAGNNREALAAAARHARQLGYRTLVLSTSIQGETREVARVHAAIAREIVASGQPVKPPACLLSGGETTVTIRGKGLGGRNQEFALAAALELGGLPDIVILSAGTDGLDGPTDAAGAIATASTLDRARRAGLDPERSLQQNDSYRFFDAIHDLIRTGPTGANVMDIRVALIGKP